MGDPGSLVDSTLRAGGTILPDSLPDPLPPELAPFVARAQTHLERATEGLDADAAIAHLEAAVVRAEVEASRLGFRFPSPAEGHLDTSALVEGANNPVVVIQRLGEDQAG